jgi:lipopolysaccharide export system protein LptA
MIINIDRAETITGFKTDSGDFRKFVGDVVLRQGTDTLYCDSAIQNSTTKNFEAFGNVKIAQMGGTKGTSDYLKYTSDKKLALMQGNVSLTDGKNNLICETATYDLGTKVATYDNWGTLHNDSTTVTSKTGVYNVNDKNAHFTGDVYITDPEYKITSQDLVYNTETKVTQFYSKSVVTRDKGASILQTSNGWYDGKNGIAHFTGHSSIWNESQYIEADTMDYNKATGFSTADGNVISLDTAHHATIYCGHLDYNQKKRIAWATKNPVLVQVNGKDTLYMAADTFYSAPMDTSKFKNPNQQIPNDTFGSGQPVADSVQPKIVKDTAAPPPVKTKKNDTDKTVSSKNDKKTKKKKTTVTTGLPEKTRIITDTAAADTTAPLYFIGYHHVLIFSDSLQGKCDSVVYTRSDSMIRMIYDPVAWSRNSQITGDTILMQLDSASMKKMYVPNNALIVSQSGPAKANLFDQIQGRTLTAFFNKKNIEKMIVQPNAECIFYNKDDAGAYLGVSQANSVRMFIYFNDEKIQKIRFEQDMHQTMTPLDKADIPGMKLSRFKWRMDEKPKSKEELFK